MINNNCYILGIFYQLDHYSFVAIDFLDDSVIHDLESRIDHQETLVLKSFDELKILVNLFGSSLLDNPDSVIKSIHGCWQLSNNIEEFYDDEFDNIYQKWLDLTNRANNMDEYGQLLYLKNFATRLNQAKYKLIIKEEI